MQPYNTTFLGAMMYTDKHVCSTTSATMPKREVNFPTNTKPIKKVQDSNSIVTKLAQTKKVTQNKQTS